MKKHTIRFRFLYICLSLFLGIFAGGIIYAGIVQKLYSLIPFSAIFILGIIFVVCKFVATFSKNIIWAMVVECYGEDAQGYNTRNYNNANKWYNNVAYIDKRGNTQVLQSNAIGKFGLKYGDIVGVRKFWFVHFIDPTIQPNNQQELNPIVLQANMHSPTYFNKIRNKQFFKIIIPVIVGLVIVITISALL